MIIHYTDGFFSFQGIVTVQYCEDELGYIKLTARSQTNSLEHDTTSNETESSGNNDGQSTDNNILRKSVQYVDENEII